MSFVYPKGARSYFKAVEKVGSRQTHFSTMFDSYYLCMLVGLDARTLASTDDLDPSGTFVDSYPANDHQPHADLIAGLLIDAEMERRGIDVGDRKSIESLMIDLLDPQSATKLSRTGIGLLNRYAAHGFQIIRETIPPPHAVEDFLVAYHRLWKDTEAAAAA